MVELLPCPFCGGAGVLEAVFPLDGGKFWAVHCRACRMIGPFTPANVTEGIAVDLWNRRVPQSAHDDVKRWFDGIIKQTS